MSYPNNLINAYNALRESALVAKRDTSHVALIEFAKHLNAAMPTVEDQAVYNTVRALYAANRRGYLACVRKTTNEATVLWTDGRSIAMWFNLSRLIFIKMKDNKFWVRAIPQHDVKKDPEDFNVSFPVVQGDGVVLKN